MYEPNHVKEKRKKLRKPFYGVPEGVFLEAAQRSVERCSWASVGLIKRHLAQRGISASRRAITSRLKALRRRGKMKL